jgi:hypothetical protein
MWFKPKNVWVVLLTGQAESGHLHINVYAFNKYEDATEFYNTGSEIITVDGEKIRLEALKPVLTSVRNKD